MSIVLREIHYECVDSTNDRIRDFARQGEAEGLYASADEQTAGKGRRGRVWESKPHDSVATSLLLKPDLPMQKIPTITTLSAIAVVRMIKRLTNIDCQIKWPNDVVIKGKKVCGILCETEPADDGRVFVIVGIGVNVHNEEFLGEIRATATSLDLEKDDDRVIHRTDVVHVLWEEFSKIYDIFIETGDLSGLKDEYEKMLVNKDQTVCIEENGQSYRGIARGVTNDGSLLVETNGVIKTVNTGEVSVRGVYGYV